MNNGERSTIEYHLNRLRGTAGPVSMGWFYHFYYRINLGAAQGDSSRPLHVPLGHFFILRQSSYSQLGLEIRGSAAVFDSSNSSTNNVYDFTGRECFRYSICHDFLLIIYSISV